MFGSAAMLSRTSCVLSRLNPTVARRFVQPNVRAISLTAVADKNNAYSTQASKPVVARQRGGLTGFLQEKTGVTGAWTLGVGVTAYVLSKEIYVINSETVVGVVLFGVLYWLVKKLGKPTAEFLDGRSANILAQFSEGRLTMRQQMEQAIAAEGSTEGMLECRKEVFEILRENRAMHLEEEYRRRLHTVSSAVRRKLDYQVAVERLAQSFEHQHLVSWLEKAVTDSTSKQDENVSQCIADLKKMQVVAV